MPQRYYSSTAGQMLLQSTISAAATSISVDTVIGLPGSTPFTLVIDPGTSLEEIVDCTAVAGTVLTITRGVDGSPAVAHNVGASVRHMATARDFREDNTHVNSSSGVHGLTGPLLGTTDTQAVFNKDLTSSTNTFPTSLATAAQLTAHAALGSGVHGVTGAIVGTTDTQTLSNKTLASPTVTGTITGDGVFSGAVSANLGTYAHYRMRFAGATNRSLFWRNDGSSTYLLRTAQNDPDGTWAAPPFPITMDNESLATVFGGTVTAANLSANMPAASAGKANKRLHWGTFSGATDSNGYAAVTHGAGFTPTVVVCTLNANAFQWSVDQIGATTFRIRVLNSSGGAQAGLDASHFYFCGE